MVECRIESEGTKIGGAGLNFPTLDFQHMTELQMGVRDIVIELERFSVAVFGFSEAPGFLQSVAILNPYRGIVRLLIERLSIMSRCRYPVPRISRPVPSGDEPRSRSREKTRPVPHRLQKASSQRRRRRWRIGTFGRASTPGRAVSPAHSSAREKLLRCDEVFVAQ